MNAPSKPDVIPGFPTLARLHVYDVAPIDEDGQLLPGVDTTDEIPADGHFWVLTFWRGVPGEFDLGIRIREREGYLVADGEERRTIRHFFGSPPGDYLQVLDIQMAGSRPAGVRLDVEVNGRSIFWANVAVRTSL